MTSARTVDLRELGRAVADLAFARFANDEWKGASCERGFLIWLDEAGNASQGRVVSGPDDNHCPVYEDLVDVARIRAAPERYLGDLHTHTSTKPNWVQQLPSVEDFLQTSVFFDLWPLTDGSTEPLEISPRLQIVQGLVFGDCIVMTPTPGRLAFTSYDEQSEAIARARDMLRAWHMVAETNLGTVECDDTPQAIRRRLRDELDRLGVALGNRVVLELVDNPCAPLDACGGPGVDGVGGDDDETSAG